MGNYQGYGLEGASAVDLVVALYDGIIRFLYSACDAVERGDSEARRSASKRALDIIIHLQSRLRMDVGGQPAQALSEFYAAIVAEILQASQAASGEKYLHAIDCVRNVRDAWRQVAEDPVVNSKSSAKHTLSSGKQVGFESRDASSGWGTEKSWTA